MQQLNNGWMARMEVEIRDLLHPIMTTIPVVEGSILDADKQTLLATWLASASTPTPPRSATTTGRLTRSTAIYERGTNHRLGQLSGRARVTVCTPTWCCR